MEEALIRITAPHFVAGIVIQDVKGINCVVGGAPIVFYMVQQRWPWTRVVNYLQRKKWQWEQVPIK